MCRPRYAIILAGGRGSRLGGVDKPGLTVHRRTLLDVALAAVAGCERIVVVGPPRDLPAAIRQTREDPPGGGPVPALAAGLAALDADTPGITDADVAVLAADLPFLTRAVVDTLADARATDAAPATFAVDSAGRLQYLLGVWDSRVLHEALSGTTRTAMREVIPAAATEVAVADAVLADVDTAAALAAARSPGGALAAIRRGLKPTPARRVSPDVAFGGALADDLVAAQPFPSFDTAAMDGYAVAGAGPWTVTDGGVAAGAATGASLRPGCAVRIATGAVVPPGADRVIRDEEIVRSRPDGEFPCISSEFERDDTRRLGSEWVAADPLVDAGTRIDDAVASVARSAGVATVEVRGPLRIVVHATGDEIAAAADRPGLIVDTASEPVANLLRRSGSRVDVGVPVADSHTAFATALATPNVDAVVLIGATGRGIADHLRGALADIDAQLLIDGIDVRPGGSLIVAQAPSRTVIVGLAGNPLAAVAGAALVLPVVVDALLDANGRRAELIAVDGLAAVARSDGWRLVPVLPSDAGRWAARAHTPTAHLRALVSAPGFALIPPAANDGDLVELVRVS